MGKCKCKCLSGINFGSPSFFCLYQRSGWWLSSNAKLFAKLFADDTSLFSVINNVDMSANELNNDLYQINKWVFPMENEL